MNTPIFGQIDDHEFDGKCPINRFKDLNIGELLLDYFTILTHFRQTN